VVLPVTGAGVLLMDDGGEHHFVSATDDQVRRIEGLQVDLGEGLCLTAYETDRHVAVVDLSSDLRYPRFSPAASAAGLGAVFSFPLRHGGERIGALELYASEPSVLTRGELDGGQTLAECRRVLPVDRTSPRGGGTGGPGVGRGRGHRCVDRAREPAAPQGSPRSGDEPCRPFGSCHRGAVLRHRPLQGRQRPLRTPRRRSPPGGARVTAVGMPTAQGHPRSGLR
jgi:hypothetical protein